MSGEGVGETVKRAGWAPFLAVVLPAVAGLGMAAFAVYVLRGLGLVLFVVLPTTMGFLGGWILRSLNPSATMSGGILAGVLSILVLGVLLMGLAMDGLVCLLMAMPIAMAAAIPGALAGHAMADRRRRMAGTGTAALMVIGLPLLMGFEARMDSGERVHEVTSSVWVDAGIEDVWQGVIAFDRIDAEPDGIFRFGIAHPIEARIEGSGVGAIRHCVFSTGAFVEPITAWEKPHLLAFDVVENPPPMKEWSIYPNLEPPHLEDTFTSTRGQFRLIGENGGTRLEGTTWYTQRLAPDFYWSIYSDAIIHRIHLRVLEHIRESAEGQHQSYR